MATLLNSESRRRYSWWWDSHISPKNSKWLQENLTDMDAKVKAMIKLIEEDADSFARRAEMYYKKRPELMKLVEEFYRAYRALAERYDHATVELRQAHRTMAEVFPSQIPYALSDDSPSGSSVGEGEPHTPEGLHPIRALLEPDELKKDVLGLSSANMNSMNNNGPYFEESNSRSKRKGLKQLNDIFQSMEAASEGSKKAGDKRRSPKPHDVSEIQSREDAEILTLGKTLSEIEAEKDAILLQYQQSLQKLSSLEKELTDFRGLEEQLGIAESQVQALREALLKLEAERDAGLLQYKNCLEKISGLENMIIQMQQDTKKLHKRASSAEMDAKNLKQYHAKLEAEKEADLLQYNQCLEMISVLEHKILTAEKNARVFSEQAARAETEVENLKQDLRKVNEEKAAEELRYEQCLGKIASMENEMFRAQEDAKRLNDEMLTVVSKLNIAEEQCTVLEKSNKTLQLEADNLAHKIAVKDQELFEKGNQLEKLQASLKDEHSRFIEIEATFQALQKLHSQSQDEQVALSKELQNRLQMLKDLETCNHDLQKDLLQAKVENRSLNELNSSSILSISNLQKENISLMEMKENLEEKVSLQVSQSNVLHQEIYHLKNEIEGLNRRYQTLVGQVNSVGLDPECIAPSVKELQNENSQLKDAFRNDKDEKKILHDKLRNMDKLLEKNAALESSMLELKVKLEGSRERNDELQETCQFLRGEKSELNAEKAILLSQLQTMTESVQKLLEKNALLDNSLSSACVELEGLRSKSKSLEDMCEMLKNEKSDLLTEKNNLITELNDVEERLGNLEIRFARLEEKYTDLEKEKEFSRSSVQELWSYLGVEKQEHANYVKSSNSRFVNLENELQALHQERKLSKKEFEEELDKAVNAQLEIFILQKFVQDLEEKNLTLLFECQRHVEASKLSNKLMSELETENLEQQVELEFLLDETEKLKIGLDQIFRALEFDLDNEAEHVMNKQISVSPILDGIVDLKTSVLKNEDEKQKLVFENLVHLTLLGQLELEGHEVRSEKNILQKDIGIMNERCEVLEKAKHELQQMNKKLSLEMETAKKQEEVLSAELEMQHDNLLNMQTLFCELQEKNCREVAGNELLLQKFLDLEGKLHLLEEDYSHYAQESVAMTVCSVVLQGFGIEKVEEIKTLSDNLSCFDVINSDLNKKIQSLGKKMDAKEIVNLRLNETIEKLKKEADDGKDLVYQLYCQISIGNILLRQKGEELFQTEQELKAMLKQNAELCRATEKLKRECEESKITQDHLKRKIVELSEDLTGQNEEIECLNSENEKLEYLVGILSEEVEERRNREENLSLELQERSNDFELWEAEASSFYFDLQISSVREVLLENKVHELAKVCESLEEEKGTKDIEIESMRERFGLLENEIGGLKAQLSAYVPVISALRDDIETLQDNTFQRRKQFSSKNQKPKVVNIASQSHEMRHDEHEEDEKAPAVDGISALLKMRSTIKAIEKTMVEEMSRLAPEKAVVENFHGHKMQKETHSKVRKGSQRNIAEFLSQENEFPSEDIAENSEPRISVSRNGVMKDIPLDEGSDSSSHCRVNKRSTSTDDPMLELWEFSEKDCCIDLGTNEIKRPITAPPRNVVQQGQLKAKQKNHNPSMELHVEKEVGIDKLEVPMSIYRGANDESSKGKVLERLASDAKKLASLQKTLQDIKMRLDVKKQGKKVDYLEFERLKTQLQHVEEAIMELVDTNDRLTNGIQERNVSSEANNSSVGSEQAVSSVYRSTTFEQAQEGSEKIKSLQLELQGIWSAVLKLEAEKKNKGKYRFPGTRTGILLKNFIHSRSNRRRKKPRFCGCARPSANED